MVKPNILHSRFVSFSENRKLKQSSGKVSEIQCPTWAGRVLTDL